MSNSYQFTKFNKATKKIENVGNMTLTQVDDTAELRFYGDIVSSTWESLWERESKAPQDVVDFLSGINKNDKLHIYINSGGGDVFGGLAIHNILKRHAGHKTVYVDGIAASIASVIAFAGDELIMPSNAQLMIHKPFTWMCGDAEEFRKKAEALDNCQKAITNVYLENVKPGITEDEITERINAETWLTGDQAAEIFNITVEQSANIAACTSNYFDNYTNLPELLNHKEKNNTTEKLQLELDLLCL